MTVVKLGPRFRARKGKADQTYVILHMNPEACGDLSAALYLFAERASNSPEHAARMLALRDLMDSAARQ